MKPQCVWVVGLVLSLFMVSTNAPAFAQSTEATKTEITTDDPFLGGCGAGEIIITELDYDEPGEYDLYEFIELNGEPYSDLSGYEIRFVTADRVLADSIPLDGYDLGRSGYLVISSDNLNVYDEAEHIIIDNEDYIGDEAGGVGLYDLEDEEYCLFVNYERTVEGFEDWLLIGNDDAGDGIGRSCRRSLAGWWSCNRIATPGGSNTVVAVEMNYSTIDSPFGFAMMVVSASLGLGAIGAFVWMRRR